MPCDGYQATFIFFSSKAFINVKLNFIKNFTGFTFH
jgi:hypothetical protein